MTREDFIFRYVLGRAKGHAGGISIHDVVRDAKTAWNLIQGAVSNDHDSEAFKCRHAIIDIARQPRSNEIEEMCDADIEGGYDAMIDIAREAFPNYQRS